MAFSLKEDEWKALEAKFERVDTFLSMASRILDLSEKGIPGEDLEKIIMNLEDTSTELTELKTALQGLKAQGNLALEVEGLEEKKEKPSPKKEPGANISPEVAVARVAAERGIFGQTAAEILRQINTYRLNKKLKWTDADFIKAADFTKDFRLNNAVYSGVLALFLRLYLAKPPFPVAAGHLVAHPALKAGGRYRKYSYGKALQTMINTGLLAEERITGAELISEGFPAGVDEIEEAKKDPEKIFFAYNYGDTGLDFLDFMGVK